MVKSCSCRFVFIIFSPMSTITCCSCFRTYNSHQHHRSADLIKLDDTNRFLFTSGTSSPSRGLSSWALHCCCVFWWRAYGTSGAETFAQRRITIKSIPNKGDIHKFMPRRLGVVIRLTSTVFYTAKKITSRRSYRSYSRHYSAGPLLFPVEWSGKCETNITKADCKCHLCAKSARHHFLRVASE